MNSGLYDQKRIPRNGREGFKPDGEIIQCRLLDFKTMHLIEKVLFQTRLALRVAAAEWPFHELA